MIIRKHIIKLEDTSPSEMARFRQIMLDIWRQQIEDDRNADEMEKLIRENYIAKSNLDSDSKKSYDNDIFYVNDDGSIIKVEVDKSYYINVVLFNGNKVLFSDLDISGRTFSWNNTNRQIVANIAGYYGKQLNIKEIGVNYDMSDKSYAYTIAKKIWLHPTSKGGVDPFFNNKYNLKSILIHEHNHQKESKKKGGYTYSDHARVFLKQFQDSTFKKTSEKFALGHISNFIQYIDYASGHNEEGWQDLIKEFNKSQILGGYYINYRESGGTQLFDNKGQKLVIEIRKPLDGPH